MSNGLKLRTTCFHISLFRRLCYLFTSEYFCATLSHRQDIMYTGNTLSIQTFVFHAVDRSVVSSHCAKFDKFANNRMQIFVVLTFKYLISIPFDQINHNKRKQRGTRILKDCIWRAPICSASSWRCISQNYNEPMQVGDNSELGGYDGVQPFARYLFKMSFFFMQFRHSISALIWEVWRPP